MPPPGRPYIPRSTSAFYADRFRTPQLVKLAGAASGSAQISGGDPVTLTATLSATGVGAGTYGDSTHVGRFTVGLDGRLTSATSVAIAFPADTGITQLTGDVIAGPGSGSQAATLAASGVTAATYGDATHVSQVTFDAKGRATSASSVAITFPSTVTLPSYNVADLPAPGVGKMAIVLDATLTAITGLGLTPTGGGSNKVPVYSDGTNWFML